MKRLCTSAAIFASLITFFAYATSDPFSPWMKNDYPPLGGLGNMFLLPGAVIAAFAALASGHSLHDLEYFKWTIIFGTWVGYFMLFVFVAKVRSWIKKHRLQPDPQPKSSASNRNPAPSHGETSDVASDSQ